MHNFFRDTLYQNDENKSQLSRAINYIGWNTIISPMSCALISFDYLCWEVFSFLQFSDDTDYLQHFCHLRLTDLFCQQLTTFAGFLDSQHINYQSPPG